MTTRNITVFYALIFLPLIVLIMGAKYQLISPVTFVSLLMGYAFIYHPFISGLRLLALDKLDRKNFWQVFVPLWSTKHFKILFF